MQQKVFEALRWASSFLEEYEMEQGIAEVLLTHHTNWSRSRWLAELQTELPVAVLEAFQRDVKKAATGVPVQHLTGKETFYGREFTVTKDVLIPRPETEELLEAVLAKIEEMFSPNLPLRIVDVGTGSGIIAITLAKELAHRCVPVMIQAVDISDQALVVAKKNAEIHEANVTFLNGDLLEPLTEKEQCVDIVVSNPPYIPERDRETLHKTVRHFDPETALFGGADGLDLYRRFAEQLSKVVATPALVAFEIGFDQGDSVSAILQKAFHGSAEVGVKQDINGKDRIVIVKI
ncbi:peptide chain release factor N(5)-glutamine methyltransferase [Alteribacter populi]|uniref:peptide chain release factor N(5)-glutamine methyltransferase n=1 Tax=Alteribacter populi TaxID=2011011 RepID=UPI000BBA8E9E|nr:peptide chain release factor N(5)-glutamine methyltransferase [Alteribacter populi]